MAESSPFFSCGTAKLPSNTLNRFQRPLKQHNSGSIVQARSGWRSPQPTLRIHVPGTFLHTVPASSWRLNQNNAHRPKPEVPPVPPSQSALWKLCSSLTTACTVTLRAELIVEPPIVGQAGLPQGGGRGRGARGHPCRSLWQSSV